MIESAADPRAMGKGLSGACENGDVEACVLAEARWPVVAAVLAAVVLTLQPTCCEVRVGFCNLEGMPLMASLTGDPGSSIGVSSDAGCAAMFCTQSSGAARGGVFWGYVGEGNSRLGSAKALWVWPGHWQARRPLFRKGVRKYMIHNRCLMRSCM
jgi:hypothetical protein